MLNSVIRISIWSLFREFSLYCEHTTIISIFISYKGNTIFTCFHFSVSIVFSIHNTQSVFAEDNSSANLYSKSVTVHYKDLSSYTYPHLQIYILSSYVSKRFFFSQHSYCLLLSIFIGLFPLGFILNNYPFFHQFKFPISKIT